VSTLPSPGAHGGDGARLADALGIPRDAVLDLSLSVNPVAPDAAAIVREHAGAVRRYPDVAPATAALADAMAVDPDRLVLTSGGADAIALVARVCPRGWVDEPDFSLYARHLAELAPGAPRWRSNPHNPTGRLARADARSSVWDEAFFPLAAGKWTRGDDAIVVGSLTKVFACPGLRAGYVLAPSADFAARIRAAQPEWPVGTIVAEALPAMLATADLARWRDEIATLRNGLGKLLARFGLHAEPSDACFVLVPCAPGLRPHLARSGVLVRDTSNFGIRDGVRIAVPDAAGLERLAAALEGYEP